VATSSGLIAETVYRDDRDQRWNQRYTRTYTYQDDSYYQQCRDKPDPAGVLIGAIIGGLLASPWAATTDGNHRHRGHRRRRHGGGPHRNLDCEDRSYAYRTYYDASIPAARAAATSAQPQQRPPRTFQVGQYYNDAGGFRCTTYSQTVYIQGRTQQARGHACRQPDGSWTVVD